MVFSTGWREQIYGHRKPRNPDGDPPGLLRVGRNAVDQPVLHHDNATAFARVLGLFTGNFGFGEDPLLAAFANVSGVADERSADHPG